MPTDDSTSVRRHLQRELRDVLTADMRAELIDTFAQSLPRCLQDIEGAVARGDRAELRRVTRLLRGSAATLGAAGLTLACESLDEAGLDADPPVGRAELERLRSVAEGSLTALRSNLV